uniref:Uncharacterized protein LOC111137726 n=1 Tax=Crassostrea virginica TaxID=6565 RepID=A0A8B8EYH3_CRAVI|nr:uncharacterized protein LOC111137726 [Crassostrea virginica]
MDWLTMRGMGWWRLPWLWTAFFLFSGAHQREGLFTRYPGMRVRTPHLTVRLSPGQATACCLTCVQYDSCYGANFHEEDGVCEISLLGVGGRTELVDANQSWNLYIRRNVLQRELVLRATAGSGVSVKDTWLGTTVPPPAQDTCVSMETTSCMTHYRNPIVNHWNQLPISQVILELYKRGLKVASVTFDGRGTSISDWFSFSRLLNSSWGSMNSSATYNYFSIDGHANCARFFFINQNYWGCPLDAGWMVVLDPHHYCCTWDNLPNKPVFLYSSLDVAVTYESGILGTEKDFADVMAIFLLYG